MLRSLTLATGLGLPSRRPAPAWILLLGLLAAALLVEPLALPRLQTPARVAAGPLVAPDEASAMAAARAEGQSVEALSDRTAFSQTYANPSGTFTLNESVLPVRVQRADGSWVPADATLQARPDGTVAPLASVAGIAFSGGGTGPLVRMAQGGDQVVLGWPAPLPVPALSGSSATYADVLPGVDLRLTAQPLGFSTLLVVKSAGAARNPALATVRLALATEGVTLRATADGGLTAVDGVDDQVLAAPASSMWDAGGAARARVGVRVGDGELDLLPDAAMLASPATAFPVSIDPTMDWVSVTGVKQAWTKADACFPDQTYWNGANDPDPQHFGEAKVGRSPEGYGDPCNGVTYRSFFQLDTAKIADKTIHSAKFNAFETYAPACNAEPVDLWWTDGISPSTDWAHMGWIKQLASWSGAHGYPPGTCSGRDWVVFDVTSMVAQIANGDSPNLTLGLRAPDESLCHSDSTGNNCQWKKFDSGSVSASDTPFLSIQYNTTPNGPTSLFTDAGSPFLYPNGQIPCSSSTNYVNTLTPILHADVSDPDDSGSSQPQPLTGDYSWSFTHATGGGGGGGVFSPSPGRTPGSGNTSLATSTTIPSGTLRDGDSVTWSVATNDTIIDGPNSATCHLTIDVAAVTALPGITSTDGLYPIGGAVPPTPVGTPGAFTLDPAGTTDVAGYVYGLNTPPWKFVRAGTGSTGLDAAVTIDPPVVGPNSLQVRIVGLGGNLGPIATYDVITGHGTTGSILLAHYGLDEGSGSLVADSTGGHDATASGSFGWTTGHTGASGDHALHLTSSGSGFAATQEPAVDTQVGFTVSAWVKLDDTNALYHVLTQDGVTNENFALEYLKGDNKWAFSAAESDGTNAVIDHALSDAAPSAGVWTHLVGVFCADPSCLAPGDTAPGRLYLYVDTGSGLTLQATQPVFSSPWLSTGGLEMGRGKFNGAQANYLNGAIDDVSVYWGDPCAQPAAPPAVSTCGIS